MRLARETTCSMHCALVSNELKKLGQSQKFGAGGDDKPVIFFTSAICYLQFKVAREPVNQRLSLEEGLG